MEILLAALVAATVSGAVALVALRVRGGAAMANGGTTAPAERPGAVDAVAQKQSQLEARESDLDGRGAQLRRRESELDQRAGELDAARDEIERARDERLLALERAAGLSAGEARHELLAELEQELRHDRAKLIRQVEDETRHDAERRARSILSTCMQRMAGGHSFETTVTTVQLESDELKGRIIGREGRNIRALENLTGIDVIVDDTPGAVVLSGFDGVRREIARITLEKLLEDGRIHPARIEEAYGQAESELDRRIVELGEQAPLEAGVGPLHPELTKLLGRLRFRTSYGQNVLAHSVECARLATLVADEIGANPKTAARAALLHDIGKAVSNEIDGPHAIIGGELARRYEEVEAVAHAMESHHNEVEPQTVEAVIVQIVDAVSGARPGARGESLERYVSRLHDLEGVASRHPGVEKVYAMHAGRELRVIVKPDEIDDDSATILSRDIAREVERELEYPGQIKVTVIRESRSTSVAK
ncbi:MAG: ribonuclease Y [Thermoleophilaceae bacterium]